MVVDVSFNAIALLFGERIAIREEGFYELDFGGGEVGFSMRSRMD